MTGETDSVFERKVKRYVYGSPHSVRILPAPGLGDALFAELGSLSGRLFTPPKFEPKILHGNRSIVVENIDYRSLCELTMRCLTPADIRLSLSVGKVTSQEDLQRVLEKTPFDLYLPPGAGYILRADSGKSRLYHEGLVEEIADRHLKGNGYRRVEDGLFHLYLNLFENRLSMEISMSGLPLWRRGYRKELKAAAPLREDLAQSAIRMAAGFHAAKGGKPAFDTLFVPFSGTGTFLFESLMDRWEIPSRAFGRAYSFESFACTRSENIRWIEGKLEENTHLHLRNELVDGGKGPVAVLIDSDRDTSASSAANADRFFSCLESLEAPASPEARALAAYRASVRFLTEDALHGPWGSRVPEKPGTVLLPLNPPFGVRLPGKQGSFHLLGTRTADLARLAVERGGSLFGFILCPDEETWSEFLGSLGTLGNRTLHFTQGGLDIRLLLFSS